MYVKVPHTTNDHRRQWYIYIYIFACNRRLKRFICNLQISIDNCLKITYWSFCIKFFCFLVYFFSWKFLFYLNIVFFYILVFHLLVTQVVLQLVIKYLLIVKMCSNCFYGFFRNQWVYSSDCMGIFKQLQNILDYTI